MTKKTQVEGHWHSQRLEGDSRMGRNESQPWLTQRDQGKEREREVKCMEQMVLGPEAEFEKLTVFASDHK